MEVRLGCSFEMRDGRLRPVPGVPSTLIGIPFDRPVVGYGGENINTLRLWAAVAPDYFDFQRFSRGEFVEALTDKIAAESLTRVLYPDDSTVSGQALRFVQEYFLVACSLADLVRRFRSANTDWSSLPGKVAIQLNDTHPALAVPELMRILLDDAHLGWDDAWNITRQTLAYTNHTLLPEALEKWPLRGSSRFCLGTSRSCSRSIVDCSMTSGLASRAMRNEFAREPHRGRRGQGDPDGERRHRRLAQHERSAAIHSDLLRRNTVRISRKCSRAIQQQDQRSDTATVAAPVESGIGSHGDRCDRQGLDHGSQPAQEAHAVCRGCGFPRSVPQREARSEGQVRRLAGDRFGQVIDPQTIIDAQVKRIHEYKRQLLNALRVVVLYNRLRENPRLVVPPRTFIFAGKAAPAYQLAKLIIKLVNNVAATIDATRSAEPSHGVVPARVSRDDGGAPHSGDRCVQPDLHGRLRGERHQQHEVHDEWRAHDRDCDGATIEMAEEGGEENFFMFGLTADQVSGSRDWYNPRWHYDNEPETRAALDLIFNDHFSPDEPGVFEPLRDTLLVNDRYMHLADLTAYLEADRRLIELYGDQEAWTAKSILNVAASGKFSSDRTIAEYAKEIWNAKPCPVP